MSDKLIEEINEIKARLENLETNFIKKQTDIERRDKIDKIVDNKIDFLINLQTERLKIRLINSENEFEISKNSLVNSKYNNNLKDLINLTPNDTYILELSDKACEIVLNIIRNSANINIKVKDKLEVENLKLEILEFFKSNKLVLDLINFEIEK